MPDAEQALGDELVGLLATLLGGEGDEACFLEALKDAVDLVDRQAGLLRQFRGRGRADPLTRARTTPGPADRVPPSS